MNETLEEFASLCHSPYSENTVDLEKFAELIVRACADEAEEWHEERGLLGFDVFANHIKKKFEVE